MACSNWSTRNHTLATQPLFPCGNHNWPWVQNGAAPAAVLETLHRCWKIKDAAKQAGHNHMGPAKLVKANTYLTQATILSLVPVWIAPGCLHCWYMQRCSCGVVIHHSRCRVGFKQLLTMLPAIDSCLLLATVHKLQGNGVVLWNNYSWIPHSSCHYPQVLCQCTNWTLDA